MMSFSKSSLYFLGFIFLICGGMWLFGVDEMTRIHVGYFLWGMFVVFMFLKEFEIVKKQQDILIDALINNDDKEIIRKRISDLYELRKK